MNTTITMRINFAFGYIDVRKNIGIDKMKVYSMLAIMMAMKRLSLYSVFIERA